MEELVGEMKIFSDAYEGKKVLVTGHTGFKGSWLSLWLLKLGADVAGFSLYVPTEPSNFEAVGLGSRIRDIRGDVRNLRELDKAVKSHEPDMIFHLAAQPIVRRSYDEPKSTFDTNLGGTVNLLEVIKGNPCVKAAVIITSDKCYRNMEIERGYDENDLLGGNDPYSASKACAEIAVRSYALSFFNRQGFPRVATTRAGNVIGGGDWADDRIIPDCVKAWSSGKDVCLRKPEATRPWQHVLEPLSGYLLLGSRLLNDGKDLSGEAFNFGPDASVVKSVGELADLFLTYWGSGGWNYCPDKEQKKESTLLSLSCEKALKYLEWRPVLEFVETVKMTADWYRGYYSGKEDVYDISGRQIDRYVRYARDRNTVWVEGGA